METTFDYGYEIIALDDAFAVVRHGEQCTTALGRAISYKSRKAAENYIAKRIVIHQADDATSDEQRQAMRLQREAQEAEAQAVRDRAYDEHLECERQAKEQRRQNAITTGVLRQYGYRWRDLGFRSEEEADAFDINATVGHDWQLYAPDGHMVSTEQAMQELAAAGVSLAKEWLAERGIAEVQANQQEETLVQQRAAEREDYQREAKEVLLEAGLSEKDAEREAKRLSLPHSPQEDTVFLLYIRFSGTDASLVIDSDFRYGIIIDNQWCGITEIIERYPDAAQQLAMYAERNDRRRAEYGH